eukprot:1170502-Pyramimonas_sp.AAC.1
MMWDVPVAPGFLGKSSLGETLWRGCCGSWALPWGERMSQLVTMAGDSVSSQGGSRAVAARARAGSDVPELWEQWQRLLDRLQGRVSSG